MRFFMRDNPAKFRPNQIRNDGVIGLLLKSVAQQEAQVQSVKNNKMSSDVGLATAIWDQFLV